MQRTLSLFLEVQGRKPWEPLKRPKPGNHETSERALLPSSKAVTDNAKNKIAVIKFIIFNFCSGIESFAYLYSEPQIYVIYYLSDIIHWQFCEPKTLHNCRYSSSRHFYTVSVSNSHSKILNMNTVFNDNIKHLQKSQEHRALCCTVVVSATETKTHTLRNSTRCINRDAKGFSIKWRAAKIKTSVRVHWRFYWQKVLWYFNVLKVEKISCLHYWRIQWMKRYILGAVEIIH